MNSNPLTPSEFRKLKTTKEKNEAYSLLWDAWQNKGEKKEILNKKVKNNKRQRQKGADKTNKLSTKSSDFLIEEYWNERQLKKRVTAKSLLKKLHEKPNKEYKHFCLKVVAGWLTDMKKTWEKGPWSFNDDAKSEFSDQVRDLHNQRTNKRKKMQDGAANS